MALTAQAIKNKNFVEPEYSEKAAIGALYDELVKGIQSMKNGEEYTVEETYILKMILCKDGELYDLHKV